PCRVGDPCALDQRPARPPRDCASRIEARGLPPGSVRRRHAPCEVGRFLHADDSATLTRWVDARKKLLREGKIWQPSSSTVSPTCGAKCRTQAQAPRPSASGSTTSFSTL